MRLRFRDPTLAPIRIKLPSPSSFDSLLFPDLPFIYALSALIFQNQSFVTDYFRNFAIEFEPLRIVK